MLKNRKSRSKTSEKIYDRDVLYNKKYKNIYLYIFEGTHEIINQYVEQLILSKNN